MKVNYPVQLNAGFTLIEVLVAFSILAVSFAVIYQVFGSGMKNSTVADEYYFAAQHASSLMMELDVSKEIELGVSTGEFDKKYSWQLIVSPSDEYSYKTNNIAAVDITLRVYWGNGKKKRKFQIESLRLVNPTQLSLVNE